MISTRLIRAFAALGLSVGVQSQGPESCVETVTARTGDTCASLAQFAGISVSQFLRSNPTVTSCEILVAGAVYCKIRTASGTPTVAASLPPFPSSPSSGPSRVSRDGTCGGDVTCSGSQFGSCCSVHGFCGNSVDYCGQGCQAGFGQCGDISEERPANPISIITVVATSTIRITDYVTTTLVTATKPPPLTPAITLLTTTKAQGSVSTGKPSPTLPRTPSNCKIYDQIRDEDNCQSIATRNSLKLRDLWVSPAPFPLTPFLSHFFPFPYPRLLTGIQSN